MFKKWTSIFGIYFYPYSINAFIQDDDSVISNHFIDIKDLLKGEYNEIAEQRGSFKDFAGNIWAVATSIREN